VIFPEKKNRAEGEKKTLLHYIPSKGIQARTLEGTEKSPLVKGGGA